MYVCVYIYTHICMCTISSLTLFCHLNLTSIIRESRRLSCSCTSLVPDFGVFSTSSPQIFGDCLFQNISKWQTPSVQHRRPGSRCSKLQQPRNHLQQARPTTAGGAGAQGRSRRYSFVCVCVCVFVCIYSYL